jgi:hypothetical protein
VVIKGEGRKALPFLFGGTVKVYAHKWLKNNEQVCIGPFRTTCTAPFGILDPQPKDPKDIHIIVISRACEMVDDKPKAEPGADHVESTVLKQNPVVEVFAIEDITKDVDLGEMAEAAERVSVETEEVSAVVSEPVSDVVEEPKDFANYSTSELTKLCDSLGIKTRKNATRASLVEKLVAAARG